jgi:shikimate dehydrogenase
MGDPVMHSRSPKLHNYWLAKYGLTGIYVPLAITAANLRAALRALSALGFSGCNLTIPHKEAALDIVDKLDPLARRIGAVNCVVVAPDGSLEGATTTLSATSKACARHSPNGAPTPGLSS